MLHFLEQILTSAWNRLQGRRRRGAKESAGGTSLGFRVVEEQVTNGRVGLSQTRRTMHVALLGKTGTGKSSLLKYLCLQDLEAGRGFVYFDLHGDATPFLLRAIATQEWKQQEHLSDRVIVISPSDREMSVGLNPLDGEPDSVCSSSQTPSAGCSRSGPESLKSPTRSFGSERFRKFKARSSSAPFGFGPQGKLNNHYSRKHDEVLLPMRKVDGRRGALLRHLWKDL
jgi:hypothetical protein